MTDKTASPVPDLRSLLAEASRPSASCTVPLKQGLAAQIRQAEVEMEQAVADGLTKPKRAAGKSPLKEAAEKVEALRAEMAASSLTFHFEALTDEERDQVRKDMGGRDNEDELSLRADAALCRRVVGPDGQDFPDRMTWEDFRDLRERIGVQVYESTISAAASQASGAVGWSVPFSSAASRILATGR